MLKVIIFANNDLGVDVVNKCLKNSQIEVIALVANSQSKRVDNYLQRLDDEVKSVKPSIPVYEWADEWHSRDYFLNLVRASDLGISAYFGHIIPPKLISEFKHGIVNLHPSLLPTGKGAHPIVWNILEKKAQGATIHLMDASLDTGSILWQQEIPTNISDTAGRIYKKASNLILQNFIQTILNWIEGEISPLPNTGEGTLHKARELERILEKKIDDVDTLENHIRWINALKFSNGGTAIVCNSSGEKWRIEVKMSQLDKDS